MSSEDEKTSVWLRRRAEPSAIDENFKDGYLDMLAERRKPFNDVTWILKRVQTPEYKYKHPREYSQLNKDVLSSDRVRNAIEKKSRSTKRSIQELNKEAEQILQEMAHKFNMNSVRTLGFFLIKVLKTINDHIYVNAKGLNMLYELEHEYPVLLVPSHRSYLDFIILSILCFNYDLPLPAIVAAQDFMGMAVVGSMLRNSGAFYIRRAFRDDDLYWAIFTEYVQTQLYNGDHPIEFFVEGTRSRTQKAYTPKLGALNACLEAYFKGMVPDIMIVPISISYDRVLEENLFAQELLGIPKPKESTSKLFKAASILKENYGSIHVTISSPLSVRSLCTGRIHRPIHSVEPRFQVSMTPEEDALIERIGLQIVWEQQKNMVLSVWCLLATVLLQSPNGIMLTELTETVLWLKRHANNVGAYIDWPGNVEDLEVIRSCIDSHRSYVNLVEDRVTIAQVDHGDRLKQANHMKGQTIADAATHIVLAIYRNQLVHVFVPYSILSMIIINASQRTSSLPKDDAKSLFRFAADIFSKEFVLDPQSADVLFEDALQVLLHTSDLILTDSGDAINLKTPASRFIQFLSNILLPFASGYWVLCQYIHKTAVSTKVGKEQVVRPKELVKSAQQFALSLIYNGYLTDYEILNLEMLNNCVQSLKHLGAVYYEKRNGERFMAARTKAIGQVIAQLEMMSPSVSVPEEALKSLAVNVSIQAKL